MFSCTYSVIIDAVPDTAAITINGSHAVSGQAVTVSQNKITVEAEQEGYEAYSAQYKITPGKHNRYTITLSKKRFPIHIHCDNGSSTVIVSGREMGSTPLDCMLEYGVHTITLRREGYADELCHIKVTHEASYIFHHHAEATSLIALGIFPCGSQPKQVLFSLDDEYILIPLLDERGFDVFSVEELRVVQRIEPPDPTGQTGYPEGLFIKEHNVFLISQMTTGNIYEYSWPELAYKRTLKTGGVWSKFLAWHAGKNIVAVSNWLSNTVSILNLETGSIINRIPTAPVPRGLAFTPSGSNLVVTSFEGGRISLYDTNTWKEIKHIYSSGSNMRHAVLSPDGTVLYVSDMGKSCVYEIDMATFTITHTYHVDDNPNTIDISPDGKLLIVSSRGPNNPTSYLLRSPRSGYITIIDTGTRTIRASFMGGNQPTGLDISNNGRYLCFSNFRDNTIELFYIGE